MSNITVTQVVNAVTVTQTNNTVELAASGPQGPAGNDNLFVGPTSPLNPQIGWVWVQTVT